MGLHGSCIEVRVSHWSSGGRSTTHLSIHSRGRRSSTPLNIHGSSDNLSIADAFREMWLGILSDWMHELCRAIPNVDARMLLSISLFGTGCNIGGMMLILPTGSPLAIHLDGSRGLQIFFGIVDVDHADPLLDSVSARRSSLTQWVQRGSRARQLQKQSIRKLLEFNNVHREPSCIFF